ncbi:MULTISPECIES: FAD-dependent oxidoreductase [Clostridium]|uniref:FAD-dependent oxidoreductase n=1 Tax=Clostridium TaxID=1485 RepID=UPI00082703AE|nr:MULTISPECIES: FAD-dependent oxidoreductase [Clostridium]PJI10348.1 FAD/NAD(P)-binding oxidoreductase [Clostridium sp. CT7]
MDYDVLILGGDIIGCAVAYELSKYNLNVSLIEKKYEIGNDTSIINSDLVYNGIETKSKDTYNLELRGNQLMEHICSELNVKFKRADAAVMAIDEESQNVINKIYNRAKTRGVKEIELLKDKKFLKNKKLKCGDGSIILSHNMGVVSPYDLTLAYGEVAFDNGVNFRLNEKVVEINKISKGFKVTTNKNKFTCKIVINTIPHKNENVLKNEEKGIFIKNNYNCFVIDGKVNSKLNDAIFALDDKGNNVYFFKDFHGNIIAKVITKDEITYEEARQKLNIISDNISEDNIIDFYSCKFSNDKVIIENNLENKGYIKIQCKNYAAATIAPTVGENICKNVVENLKCKAKKDFYNKRREIYRFRYMDNEQKKKVIAMNSKYGRIICACKQVTEGEIIDAIRRPLGARTLYGIMRRTGALSGECCGSSCEDKVAKILAKETNKKLTDILNKGEGSNIVTGRIKEFNEM